MYTPKIFIGNVVLVLRTNFRQRLWDWMNIHSRGVVNSMWDSIKCIQCALCLTEVTNHHWNSTAQQDALCQLLVPRATPVSGINPLLVLVFFGFVLYEINTEPESQSNTLINKHVKDQKQGTRNWLVHLKKIIRSIKSRSACRVTRHQFPVWNLHIDDTEDNLYSVTQLTSECSAHQRHLHFWQILYLVWWILQHEALCTDHAWAYLVSWVNVCLHFSALLLCTKQKACHTKGKDR